MWQANASSGLPRSLPLLTPSMEVPYHAPVVCGAEGSVSERDLGQGTSASTGCSFVQEYFMDKIPGAVQCVAEHEEERKANPEQAQYCKEGHSDRFKPPGVVGSEMSSEGQIDRGDRSQQETVEDLLGLR